MYSNFELHNFSFFHGSKKTFWFGFQIVGQDVRPMEMKHFKRFVLSYFSVSQLVVEEFHFPGKSFAIGFIFSWCWYNNFAGHFSKPARNNRIIVYIYIITILGKKPTSFITSWLFQNHEKYRYLVMHYSEIWNLADKRMCNVAVEDWTVFSLVLFCNLVFPFLNRYKFHSFNTWFGPIFYILM